MANSLSKTGITTGDTVRAGHVTQSIDAFSGTSAYDITISGSLTITGSTDIQGNITAVSMSGDGSGITGVTGEWDGSHLGDASITGSLTVTSDISASGEIYVNKLQISSSLDKFHFRDKENPDDPVLTLDGGSIRLGIGLEAPTEALDVAGNIKASGNVSGSATSTASFGTYLGDGSQLTGIAGGSTFPFTGSAEITGSLTVAGPLITSTPSGLSNTIIGSGSAPLINAGAYGNVIIGNQTATGFTGGDDNVIIGESAALSVTNGYDNVYIGHQSGMQAHSTNAIGNVVIGNDAGLSSGTGASSVNTFIGRETGYNADGAGNVYVGWRSGYGEAGADGQYNCGYGSYAMYANRDGNYNIGIGYHALSANKDGSNNIFIGSGSIGEENTESQLRIGHAGLTTISASLTTGDIIFPSTASAQYYTTPAGQISTISASYAITASHALNAGGGGSTFPFTGDAEITGSLIISASATSQSLSVIGSGSTVFDVIGSAGTLFSVDDDLTGMLFTTNDISGFPVLQASASGELYLGKSPQSLYTTSVISATSASVTESLCTLSTSSYDGAFFDYTIISASNARAGNIMSIWNGGSISHTETTTTDIGSTSGIAFDMIISQSQAQLVVVTDSTDPNTWKVKTIIRSI